MESSIDVFGARVVFGVFGQCFSSFIVDVERDGRIGKKMKLLQYALKPQSLLAQIRHGLVFGLSAG
jgi:hypothetical protein